VTTRRVHGYDIYIRNQLRRVPLRTTYQRSRIRMIRCIDMKRDLCIRKETYTYEKRPHIIPHICDNCNIHMCFHTYENKTCTQGKTYTYEKSYDACRCAPYIKGAVFICIDMKRDLYIRKKTTHMTTRRVHSKRHIHTKRQLLTAATYSDPTTDMGR